MQIAACEQVIVFSHDPSAATSVLRQDRSPSTSAGRRGRFSDAQTSPFKAPGASEIRCERWIPPAEAPRRHAPRRSTNS